MKDHANRGGEMEKKTSWRTGDGREATVTVTLVTSRRVGDWGTEIACCEINVVAEVAGQHVGVGRPEPVAHPVAVGRIGKLGMTAANLALVNAAIAELEATPEWQEHLSREQRSGEVVEADERRRKALDDMMTLNGGTF